jgi:hypothetical protein
MGNKKSRARFYQNSLVFRQQRLTFTNHLLIAMTSGNQFMSLNIKFLSYEVRKNLEYTASSKFSFHYSGGTKLSEFFS